jgi:hypothetical protein
MAMEDKVEKIKKVARKEGAAAKVVEPQEDLQRLPPNKERFDNLMQPPKAEKIANEQKFDPSKKTALMDGIHELNTKNQKPTKITPTELIAEVDKATNQIDHLKARLSEPGSKLKESAVPLLRNKISHVDEGIRIALSHSGSEFSDAASQPVVPKENVISRFLGLLTNGQFRLETLSNDIERMASDTSKEINPAKLLLIQVKVGQIQQELEFFAGVLNKALESTKTIMNVQV